MENETKPLFPVGERPSSVKGSAGPKFYRRPIFLVSLLAILGLLAAGWFGWQNKNLKNNLSDIQNKLQTSNAANPQAATATEMEADKQLIEAVGKLIILPPQEQPTIATVTDLEKLKGQAFFASAQVGDKVLIYTEAQKAILYRPSENKIIELAPLNIDANAKTPPANNLTAAQKITIEIRNASGKTGAAGELKQKLSAYPEFSVKKTANAAGILEKTVVVDLSGGSKSALADSLARRLGAEKVMVLPQGEAAGSTEAVVLIGKQ